MLQALDDIVTTEDVLGLSPPACYANYLEEAAQAAAPVPAPQLFSEEMHELQYFYPATIAAQCRAPLPAEQRTSWEL